MRHSDSSQARDGACLNRTEIKELDRYHVGCLTGERVNIPRSGERSYDKSLCSGERSYVDERLG
jgi:hypothetical protein